MFCITFPSFPKSATDKVGIHYILIFFSKLYWMYDLLSYVI
jgi:hypothetical protein